MAPEQHLFLRAWLVAIAGHVKTLPTEEQHPFILRELRRLTQDYPVEAIVDEWLLVRMKHLPNVELGEYEYDLDKDCE